VVPIGDLRFRHRITRLGVVPARLRSGLPRDQACAPGQFEDTGRRQFVVDLHLEPGSRASVGSEFTGTDDHDQVFGSCIDSAPAGCCRLRSPCGRGKGGEHRLVRVVVFVDCCQRVSLVLCQRLHVEHGVGESTGQVELQRFGPGLGPALGRHRREQFGGHLPRRPGLYTRSLHGSHEPVVVAHQSGARNPTDQRVGEGDLGVP